MIINAGILILCSEHTGSQTTEDGSVEVGIKPVKNLPLHETRRGK